MAEMTPQKPRTPRKRSTKKGTAEEGKVLKVLYLDEKGESIGEWSSQALPENQFDGLDLRGIQEPPFSMEQLVYLAELHPVHGSALEQKTADVLGKGWTFMPEDDDAQDDDEQKKEVEEWFESLSPGDIDMKEMLSAVWLDFETIGWGLVELVRDPSGVLKRAYHVPAHTVRAHKDGIRLVQIRGNKQVWFKRWGSPDRASGRKIEVDSETGALKKTAKPASELLVIKKPSRRSTWYGIPDYVSGIGWITLALAARDDNLLFFQNRREPRWAIVLTNLAAGETTEEDLRRAFTVDLKQPHRNIVVPIEGPGKVNFQKLASDRQDGSFDKLSERADRAIMVSHRTPAERLANADIGPLGGNAVTQASRIYKEGVVQPRQEFLANRLNRLIDVEYPRAIGAEPDSEAGEVKWKLEMDDLDLGTDAEELDQAVQEFKADLCTLREARQKMGRGPLMVKDEDTGEEVESPYNDMLWSELPGNSSFDDAEVAPPPRDDPVAAARARFAEQEARELAQSLRDTERRIASLLEDERVVTDRRLSELED